MDAGSVNDLGVRVNHIVGDRRAFSLKFGSVSDLGVRVNHIIGDRRVSSLGLSAI